MSRSGSGSDDDELLVNLNDALIYRRDLRILQSPTQWLNSDCIHFQVQCLQNSSFYTDHHLDDVIPMDPSVTSFLVHQCNDEDEIQELRSSRNSFIGIRWIYLPINDAMFAGNTNWWASQGTHWSLLRIHIPMDSGLICFAEHYNSMIGTNHAAATSVYEKIQILIPDRCFEPQPRLMEKFPQQSNGFDCGLHVLFMIEQLLQGHNVEHMTELIRENPRLCADLRRQMAQTVEKLSKESQK